MQGHAALAGHATVTWNELSSSPAAQGVLCHLACMLHAIRTGHDPGQPGTVYGFSLT